MFFKSLIKTSLFFIIIFVSFCLPAQAVLDIKISPADGYNTIRFGHINDIDVSKEVRFRIISTEGKQYQVFQRLLEPLSNERGEMPSRSVIHSTALLGSNSTGTLHMQSDLPLSYNDQVLYTSSNNGLGDEFTMVYQVDQSAINFSGEYIGKILYVVRSIGDGSQDEEILTVLLYATDDFSYDFQFSAGQEKILLEVDEKSLLNGESFIKLTYNGFRGEMLKITQELLTPLLNEMNEEIDPALVMTHVTSDFAIDGILDNDLNLEFGPKIVFQSPSTKDSVLMGFKVDSDQIKHVKAGKYSGMLRYTLETAENKFVKDIDITVDIAPIFYLSLTFPDEGMKFERVLPVTPPQIRDVLVTVHSNLKKSYAVVQSAQHGLINEDGYEMESKYFEMKGEIIDGFSGRIESPAYTSFPVGETPVFISDGEGRPSQFKVYYRLTPYRQMEAGNYMTSIVYSLSEL